MSKLDLCPTPDKCFITETTTCNTCYAVEDLCLACAYGYYLKESECIKCPDLLTNCVDCSDENTCDECEMGFILQDKCVGCSDLLPNCMYCSSATNCSECKTDYYLENGECLLDCRVDACLSCSPDPESCELCSDGFYLQNKLCIKCGDTIEHCIQCSDFSTCTLCEVDYSPVLN